MRCQCYSTKHVNAPGAACHLAATVEVEIDARAVVGHLHAPGVPVPERIRVPVCIACERTNCMRVGSVHTPAKNEQPNIMPKLIHMHDAYNILELFVSIEDGVVGRVARGRSNRKSVSTVCPYCCATTGLLDEAHITNCPLAAARELLKKVHGGA